MLYLAPENKQKQKPRKSKNIDWPKQFETLEQLSHSQALKRYYSQGISSPDTPINKTPMVAVDFETTGLDPEQHGIVSIAAIPMTTERILFSEAKAGLLNHDAVLRMNPSLYMVLLIAKLNTPPI